MGSGPSRRPRRRKRPRRSPALACYGQARSRVEARRVTARSAGAGLCPKTPQRSKAEGDKHGGRFDEQVRSTPSQAVAAGGVALRRVCVEWSLGRKTLVAEGSASVMTENLVPPATVYTEKRRTLPSGKKPLSPALSQSVAEKPRWPSRIGELRLRVRNDPTPGGRRFMGVGMGRRIRRLVLTRLLGIAPDLESVDRG